MSDAEPNEATSEWHNYLSWLVATTAGTVLAFAIYDQLVLGNFPPTRKVEIEFYYWLALLGTFCSAFAVWARFRLKLFVVALFVTVPIGFFLAYGVGMISYGYKGESFNGLLFRALGGAIVGVVAVVVAWVPLQSSNTGKRQQSDPVTYQGTVDGKKSASPVRHRAAVVIYYFLLVALLPAMRLLYEGVFEEDSRLLIAGVAALLLLIPAFVLTRKFASRMENAE